uniref:TACI cysteine-rich domain-containing protein n=1 Tax=Myripristis murdjan TaxID=586833 RepID=A0A667XWS0_9TELE
MGRSCPEGQYWDGLVTDCVGCQTVCQQPHKHVRCNKFCLSAECKAMPGHYYDNLLRKCMRCADICGGHPAEFPRKPTLAAVQKPAIEAVSPAPTSRGRPVLTAPPHPTILLYSLLALCMVLLLSALCVALAVCWRRARVKTSRQGPRATDPGRGAREAGEPGQSPTDRLMDSSILRRTEPNDDSTPTETCVCVHCFPDPRAPNQADERPLGLPFSFYQQALLHQPTSSSSKVLLCCLLFFFLA